MSEEIKDSTYSVEQNNDVNADMQNNNDSNNDSNIDKKDKKNKKDKKDKKDKDKKDKDKNKEKKKSKILEYLKETKSELKRVSWSSKSQTFKNTVIVLSVLLISTSIVWIFDTILSFILKTIIK